MTAALTINTPTIALGRAAPARKTGIANFSIAQYGILILYEVLRAIDAVFTGSVATACHTLRIKLESDPGKGVSITLDTEPSRKKNQQE
jgi:hypothetical protein